MKDIKLGDFEETLLLIVGILAEDAYSFRVGEEYESQTGRSTSIGAVHSTLNRLSEKGYLKSKMGEPTAERGGRRKRIYEVTAEGENALSRSKELKMALWNQYPSLSGSTLKLGSV